MKQPLNPYFVPAVFCLKEGTTLSSADGCVFNLLHPSVRKDEELFAAAEDIARMFGPQMQLQIGQNSVSITWDGKSVEAPVTQLDGAAYICVNDVFETKFGGFVQTFTNHYGTFTVFAKEKPAVIDRGVISYSFSKKVGILHRAYYMEEVHQLIPYHLYVPTTYRPDQATPLAVVLHGLPGRDNFVDAGKELCQQAEERGYIICSPNGYARGMHGSPCPMRRDFVPDDVDPENPAGLDEEQKRIYPLCEKADMTAVFTVLEEENIDRSRVVLFGTSMGGDGTFHLGQKYHTLWRAIAPCAGGSDLRFYPHERLKGLPVLLLVGTEDSGYENICDLYAEMKALGLDVRLIRVPGEPHPHAWIAAMPQIFEFFDQTSTTCS